jgi:acyl carrier protein
MRDEIRQRVKVTVLRGLRIQDMTPDQVGNDQALLGSDFDIDSIDMLQLILEVEKEFGIKLVSGEFDRSEWATIDTLAGAVEKRLQTKVVS